MRQRRRPPILHKRFATNKGRIWKGVDCAGGRTTADPACFYPEHRGGTAQDWRKVRTKLRPATGTWTYKLNGRNVSRSLPKLLKSKIHLDRARIDYHSGIGMIRKYGPFSLISLSGLPPPDSYVRRNPRRPALRPGFSYLYAQRPALGLGGFEEMLIRGASIDGPGGAKGWRKYYSRGNTYTATACYHLLQATKLFSEWLADQSDPELVLRGVLSRAEVSILRESLQLHGNLGVPPRVSLGDRLDIVDLCTPLLAALPTKRLRRMDVDPALAAEIQAREAMGLAIVRGIRLDDDEIPEELAAEEEQLSLEIQPFRPPPASTAIPPLSFPF